MTKYYFNNTNKLIKYIKERLEAPTQIKVDLSIYLLWAYYYALARSNNFTPEELCHVDFKASQTGPKPVFLNAGQNEKHKINRDINKVLNQMLKQINSLDDYNLIALCKRDSAYHNALSREDGMLDKNEIYEDYFKHFQENIKRAKKNK